MVEELHSVILDTKEGCHQERLPTSRSDQERFCCGDSELLPEGAEKLLQLLGVVGWAVPWGCNVGEKFLRQNAALS